MTFADLAAGEAIFLDANLFVYHFVSDPRTVPLAVSFSSASRTKKSGAQPPRTSLPRWPTAS